MKYPLIPGGHGSSAGGATTDKSRSGVLRLVTETESPTQAQYDRRALELHRTGITRTVFPDALSEDLESLCSRVGRTPDEIPHLLDVMYREAAMLARYSELVRRHERMSEYHLPALREKAIASKEGDCTLVQTFVPIPLDLDSEVSYPLRG
ncbi:MAG: hypothetical protein ACRD6W_06375 [Nitrososphaerales archaeon]